ncbi:hypothetical protein J2S43_003934 [Catenuloplanes nepalensis]|uniref:HNH endonuclease n=1 Tax=Catenuloplanes nepalensis TaxID=587533 RepID=A0ABT9MVG0_9ACTN|nr:hypothetical protein [Catenuloplanes nepalensis]MDP9795422.1 hypothetical protein [Catenuloplanes nepalensis]
MAVTFIRRLSKSGSGGRLRRNRWCEVCETRYNIDLDPERLVVDVVGLTCRMCNPRRRHVYPDRPQPIEADAVPASTVKIWWASRAGVLPRLTARRIDAASNVSEPFALVEPPLSVREGAARIDPDGSLRATVARRAHEPGRRLIAEAWRPEYCGLLVQLAYALDRLAVTAITGGVRLVLRIVGAPPLVSALTADALARAVESADPAPLRAMSRELKATAIIQCLDTQSLDDCTAADVSDDLADLVSRWLTEALPATALEEPRAEPEVVDMPQGAAEPDTGPGVAAIAIKISDRVPDGPYIFGTRPADTC